MTLATVLVVGAFGLLGANPYTVIASCLVGLGTLGVIAVQAVTALSVLVFFRKRPDRSVFRSFIAPTLGFLGLGTAFVLAALNYDTLSGSTNRWTDTVPLLPTKVAAMCQLGAGVTWPGLRTRKPSTCHKSSRRPPSRRRGPAPRPPSSAPPTRGATVSSAEVLPRS